jgi:hypothetical protein
MKKNFSSWKKAEMMNEILIMRARIQFKKKLIQILDYLNWFFKYLTFNKQSMPHVYWWMTLVLYLIQGNHVSVNSQKIK